jgi:hypothetical protein
MRAYQWLAAIALAAALAAPARAQSAFTWGNGFQNMTFRVVDTRNQSAPIASPQTVTSTGTNLLQYFHTIVAPATSPINGSSSFPTPSQAPNASYLSGFQYRRGTG